MAIVDLLASAGAQSQSAFSASPLMILLMIVVLVLVARVLTRNMATLAAVAAAVVAGLFANLRALIIVLLAVILILFLGARGGEVGEATPAPPTTKSSVPPEAR